MTLIVRFKKIVILVARFVQSIIAPLGCAYCDDSLTNDSIFCLHCFASIKPIVSHELSITDTYSITVFAISDYKDPVKKLILAKSYSNQLAARQLGKLLWNMTDLKNIDFDYIVPIPLHWTRYAYRGFNQAEEIARSIAQASGKQIVHLLKRHKRTKFQYLLPFAQRKENIKDAFVINNKDIQLYKDKKLLLVDDVMTSGTTLCMAARTLKTIKPKAVIAAVACRVV